MHQPKKFYIGIKACIIAKSTGRLVIFERTKETKDPSIDNWEIPGGRMDADEDFLETLSRELSEEIFNMPEYVVDEQGLGLIKFTDSLQDGTALVMNHYRLLIEEEFDPDTSNELINPQWVTKKEFLALNEGENKKFPKNWKPILQSFEF